MAESEFECGLHQTTDSGRNWSGFGLDNKTYFQHCKQYKQKLFILAIV
jgi:hypothetical protein